MGCRDTNARVMKAITKIDLERLRRRIGRVKGGRMDPGPSRAPLAPASIEGEESAAERVSESGAAAAPAGVNGFAGDLPEHYEADKLLDGEVIENQHGRYFLSERFYPGHRLHGSMEFSRLGELPGALLEGISRGEIPAHEPNRWAFLDTETTGLAGGTGTCAFLVGVGTIEDGGFRVRLFFMRDYDEEAAMLAGLAEFLRWYDVLVTYNGKAYDSPLLETRYRLARHWFPFERMFHLDLLHGARQLWKLRLESCRLVELESEILGVIREGDLPSELIPYYYFEYLRTKQAFRLVPLFHHNAVDIVSLACLTAVVLPAFAAPTEAALRHGSDLLGLARWLRRSSEDAPALELYRRAVDAGLGDEKLFPALWEWALLEKKRRRYQPMLEMLTDLSQVKNPFRAAALVELAKHYEHREKDCGRALEMAQAALRLEPSSELAHRKQRLERKISQQRPKTAEKLFQ